MRLPGLLALVVISGASMCCSVIARLPPGTKPFNHPAVYARWWTMMEACSGRSGDLASVHWYGAPRFTRRANGESRLGFWRPWGNRIVLAEDVIWDGRIVRHEMLHALRSRPGHPAGLFAGTCASLLACGKSCASWHPPRAEYVIMRPDSFIVRSRAQLLAREADGQRWVTLEITVRNSRDRAVIVAAPGDSVTPGTFGYDLRGPYGGLSGGDVATDSSTLVFQPFETKRRLFEFRVSSDLTEYRITSGKYLIRGDYARQWTAYDTVIVSP